MMPGALADALPLEPFAPMRADDLDAVEAVESQTYAFPWTRGNFMDSLYSGYECWIMRDRAGMLLGYFVLMLAVDEAHLLNITVRPDHHGQGLGRMLLDRITALARLRRMESVLLEVRPSNHRALDVYERYGFIVIGQRKGYYPAGGEAREDAIVMRLWL